MKFNRINISVRDSVYGIIEKSLRILSSVLVTSMFIRLLGPEEFGEYFHNTSVFAIVMILSLFGMDGVLQKIFASEQVISHYKVKTVICLRLGITIITTLLFFIILLDEINLKLFSIGVLLALFTSFRSIETIYYKERNIANYHALNIIVIFMMICLKLLYYFFGTPTTFGLYLVVLIEELLVITFLIKNNKEILKSKISLVFAKRILKTSWPLALSSTLSILYINLDIIFIKEILGSEFAGLYGSVSRLVIALFFVPNIISSLFIVEIFESRGSRKMRLYREFYGLLWVIGFTLGFMLYLFAPLIVSLLYGSSYYESVSALRIYSICLPFAFVLIGSGRWYIDNNQELLAFWRTLAALLINVLGNLVLIPLLGIDGAAFATVSSYIFALGAMWFNQKTRNNLVLVVRSLIPVRFYNSEGAL